MERTSNEIVRRELKSVLLTEARVARSHFSIHSPATALHRPIMASYCVFVRDSEVGFTTHEARCDERVKDRPKQHTVQAYCGVPIFNQDGKMTGTICHFDFQPRRIDNLDVDLLKSMAELVQRKL